MSDEPASLPKQNGQLLGLLGREVIFCLVQVHEDSNSTVFFDEIRCLKCPDEWLSLSPVRRFPRYIIRIGVYQPASRAVNNNLLDYRGRPEEVGNVLRDYLRQGQTRT